jgi:hypothetical protein
MLHIIFACLFAVSPLLSRNAGRHRGSDFHDEVHPGGVHHGNHIRSEVYKTLKMKRGDAFLIFGIVFGAELRMENPPTPHRH